MGVYAMLWKMARERGGGSVYKIQYVRYMLDDNIG